MLHAVMHGIASLLSLSGENDERSRFGLNPLPEAIAADDPQAMDSTRDALVTILGFHLERNRPPVGMDHARATGDLFTGRSWREMFDVDMDSHGALASFQDRQNSGSCGVFQKPDKPGRAEHGWHLVIGEIDDVLFVDDKAEFTDFADLRVAFHDAGLSRRLHIRWVALEDGQ